MRMSLKIIIYLMTASVRFVSASEDKGRLKIKDWDDNTPIEIPIEKINRHTGETLEIECMYPDSHESNEKSLCMGEDPCSCVRLIHTTDQKCVTKGRFHMRDNRREKYFYVHISNLCTEDSGFYWCMSELKCPEIDLSVGGLLESSGGGSGSGQEGSDSTQGPSTSSGSAKATESASWIAAAVICPALLLILVLVLILCRHKLPWTKVCCAAEGSSEQETNAEHNTEGNHGDPHYEEIQIQNQQASSGEALPSVYATVNPPGDQLLYAGVKFQENSFGVSTGGNALPDTNIKGSSVCVYSSISRSQGDTHPPAAEQSLYSAVTTTKAPGSGTADEN